MSEQAGARDQRPLEARPDVLCYTSAPLTTPLEIIGPVRLELSVQSSVSSTDFVGRLCVVQPDGTSLNLCEGLCRVAPDSADGPQTDIRHITINL
jgi:hypothetical protein